MALHGNNESSRKIDSNSNVNPVSLMTEQLQKAYSKAGEDMAKQMAAAVVSIVTGITSGQCLPGISGWSKENIPDSFKSIVPQEKLEETMWLMIIAPEINEIPLFQGNPIWGTELTSGHRLLALG